MQAAASGWCTSCCARVSAWQIVQRHSTNSNIPYVPFVLRGAAASQRLAITHAPQENYGMSLFLNVAEDGFEQHMRHIKNPRAGAREQVQSIQHLTFWNVNQMAPVPAEHPSA